MAVLDKVSYGFLDKIFKQFPAHCILFFHKTEEFICIKFLSWGKREGEVFKNTY